MFSSNPCIDLGTLQVGMAQEVPDLFYTYPAIQQVGGYRVAQIVKCYPLRMIDLSFQNQATKPSPKTLPHHPAAIDV